MRGEDWEGGETSRILIMKDLVSYTREHDFTLKAVSKKSSSSMEPL